jgi:diguanylate cyclase (GGDEF)-like protein
MGVYPREPGKSDDFSMQQYQELVQHLSNLGKDPSRLIFEDELTGIANRRFLLHYLDHKVRWEERQDYPLSLLMMDVDHFKQINDAHGHEVGDQVLGWIASLLKEVAGENDVPIRYAGDEFMLLMPRAHRFDARNMARLVLEKSHNKPFRLKGRSKALKITLSVGVASAPEDARSARGLIHKADIALYFAKQNGRNRAAVASEVEPEKVFARAALHQLEEAKIAGRKSHLALTSEALQRLGQKQSQFIIFDGGPGMGKSTLLEAIRRSLAHRDDAVVVRSNGVAQELGRPYYLIAQILVSLLSRRPDQGAAVLERLSPQELAYLAPVLPRVSEAQLPPLPEDDRLRREGIFTTLAQLIVSLLETRPLVLLIDDLEFCDEASLLLLRFLLQRNDSALLICGFADSFRRASDSDVPLERFYTAFQTELGLGRVRLEPLAAADIAEHLKTVFPGLSLPEDLEKELAEITQGNPLFLNEIVRKLVLDQKVILVGQRWALRPLPEGYLPRSLEEVVTQKLAALDREGRELLAQAAALGEDLSLSLLAGSSTRRESEVVEFIDRARNLGFVSSEFQLNDESIRFIGKRILELCYGSISAEEREALHERLGDYQEDLYQKRLLPSASILAYHFKRSANQEKALRYEQLRTAYQEDIFNAQEARQYLPGGSEEPSDAEDRLDPASLPHVPTVVRLLLTGVRNIRLYPPESKAILNAELQLRRAIEQVLEKNERLHFQSVKQALLINGQKADLSDFRLIAIAFLELLSRSELLGLAFERRFSEEELRALLRELGHLKPETIDRGFWDRFSAEHRLVGIKLQQVRYTKVERRPVQGRDEKTPAATVTLPPTAPVDTSAIAAREASLGPEELAQIPRVLRNLLVAARNARIYPPGSAAVASGIEQLAESLQDVLARQPVLTLAGAGRSLLVNGERVDTSEFEVLAESLLRFLDTVGLRSLTFRAGFSQPELNTFITALRQTPGVEFTADFWAKLGWHHGLSGILFNVRHYEIGAALSLPGRAAGEPGEPPPEPLSEAQWLERLAQETLDALLESLPLRLKELLASGDSRRAELLLRGLFADFRSKEVTTRERILTSCGLALDSLPVAHRQQLIRLLFAPLLGALPEETEPRVLKLLAAVLYRMAVSVVQFRDYPLASRILAALVERLRKTPQAELAQREALAEVVEQKPESSFQRIVLEELKSSDPAWQEKAAELLGSLGRASASFLIEVIKNEEDFAIRRRAATLLGDLGGSPVKLFRRELTLRNGAEERKRILEVIDTVTQNVEDELAYNLGDTNPQVRQAAFQLAERLPDGQIDELLLDLARGKDLSLSISAIRVIAARKVPAAVEVLSAVLDSASEPDQAVACCQALGLIGSPAAIPALARVLAPRRPLFGKRWNDQVRATAAHALSQISHFDVARVLAPLVDDRDPRIRRAARMIAARGLAESATPDD